MTVTLRGGPFDWSMSRDTDGHRTYKVSFRVNWDGVGGRPGPAVIINTPGLPQPGNVWSFYGDYDPWAFCLKDVEVNPEVTTETSKYWTLKYTFSTKNPKKCQDDKIEDPLLEPQKISGSFIKDKEEATADRFGRPVFSSSWEQLRGPQVEFDVSRHQVKIEQNVSILNLPLVTAMKDTVNDRTLWGLPRRCIRLAGFSWERKYWGTCNVYYTRTFEFETNPNTFDRNLLDEGNKVLRGKWGANGDWELIPINGQDPNPYDPRHFERFKDRKGENARVILNGRGLPAGSIVSTNQEFISAWAVGVVFNQGNLLSDTTHWVPLIGDKTPPVYGADVNYQRGQLVKVATDNYVCVKETKGIHPTEQVLDENDLPVEYWRFLNGPIADAGRYDQDTDYAEGQYVKAAFNTAVGMIHVEKYGESNFLLLGIPAIL